MLKAMRGVNEARVSKGKKILKRVMIEICEIKICTTIRLTAAFNRHPSFKFGPDRATVLGC